MNDTSFSPEKIMELLPLLLNLATKAGDAIMEIYGKEIKVSYKTDRSPLTEADLRSTEIIVNGLKEISPQIPIICEETVELDYQLRKQSKQIWLVDPLDGTKEFIRKNDEFAVNIALIEENYPIAGIIYAPVSRLCYYAVKGKGAYKLAQGSLPEYLSPMKPNPDLQNITVAISRSHLSAEDTTFIEKLKLQHPSVTVLPYGSSLKFGLLAEGKADVYPKFGYTMEWDTASGQIILEEAGAKILSNETGQPLLYNKEDTRNPYFIASRQEFIGSLIN